MLTIMMKYISAGTLILAAVLWNYAAPYELVLGFVVAVGAILVGLQAVRARKYAWAVGFYAIAVVFNPFLPFGAFSGIAAYSAVTFSIGLFLSSIYALKTQPLMSVPSITDRNPGSRSL